VDVVHLVEVVVDVAVSVVHLVEVDVVDLVTVVASVAVAVEGIVGDSVVAVHMVAVAVVVVDTNRINFVRHICMTTKYNAAR
jgi:hypothetical protein